EAGLGLPVAPFHVGQHAFEGVPPQFGLAARIYVAEGEHIVAAAVEDYLLNLLWQLGERRVDVELVLLGQAGDELEVVGVAAVPAANGAGGQAELGLCDHSCRVEELAHAQTIATRACPFGVVERKQPWLEVADA